VLEVHSGSAPHQLEYPGYSRVLRRLSGIRRFDRGLSLARQGHELQRDSGWRQNIIDHARGHCAFRHAVELRSSRILSEGDTARGFDGLEAQGPIGGGSRQNDAPGPCCRGPPPSRGEKR